MSVSGDRGGALRLPWNLTRTRTAASGAQNAFDAERRIDYRAKRRSAAPVAAAFVVAVVAAPLRRHSRFVGSTALVAAFVSLPDCIIAILVAAEQSAQGLLPVGCL